MGYSSPNQRRTRTTSWCVVILSPSKEIPPENPSKNPNPPSFIKPIRERLTNKELENYKSNARSRIIKKGSLEETTAYCSLSSSMSNLVIIELLEQINEKL